MSMLDGTATLMPDGSLVIPREEYLGAVALVKWDLSRPDGAESVLEEGVLDVLQAIVVACEHLGMKQATYHEVDSYMAALNDGALEGANGRETED